MIRRDHQRFPKSRKNPIDVPKLDLHQPQIADRNPMVIGPRENDRLFPLEISLRKLNRIERSFTETVNLRVKSVRSNATCFVSRCFISHCTKRNFCSTRVSSSWSVYAIDGPFCPSNDEHHIVRPSVCSSVYRIDISPPFFFFSL